MTRYFLMLLALSTLTVTSAHAAASLTSSCRQDSSANQVFTMGSNKGTLLEMTLAYTVHLIDYGQKEKQDCEALKSHLAEKKFPVTLCGCEKGFGDSSQHNLVCNKISATGAVDPLPAYRKFAPTAYGADQCRGEANAQMGISVKSANAEATGSAKVDDEGTKGHIPSDAPATAQPKETDSSGKSTAK